MPSFSYDAEAHVYRIDGKIVPGITQIIKPLVDYSMVPPHILENAANFGRAVHRMVELEESCSLDEDTLDDGLRKALEAYRVWRIHAGLPDFPACEIPMGHAKLGYAGTPDQIYDGCAVVEIKSRDVNPLTDPIQTAAQELLWLANGGAKGDYRHAVLTLKADGTHKFTEFTKVQKKEGLSRWRYMLDTHKMQSTIQSWRKVI